MGGFSRQAVREQCSFGFGEVWAGSGADLGRGSGAGSGSIWGRIWVVSLDSGNEARASRLSILEMQGSLAQSRQRSDLHVSPIYKSKTPHFLGSIRVFSGIVSHFLLSRPFA